MYQNNLYILGIVFLLTCILIYRFNRRYSVSNKKQYSIIRHLYLGNRDFEDPLNFEIINEKITPCSDKILKLYQKINSCFYDKIEGCFPNHYAIHLPMLGSFPSIEECGLGEICELMKNNINIFREDFNTNRDKYIENPEKLGYNQPYGRIDVLNSENEDFEKTKEVLNRSNDFTRTQFLNRQAGYTFLSTTFTVLYPGGSIRPHHGPTNYKWRIHLCIDIDGKGGLVTLDGTRYWKEGEIFILDDSYLHAGFYEGTKPRVILMVDIAKPGIKLDDIECLIE